MKFTIRGNQLFYNDELVDVLESKGHAICMMNFLEVAYKDGFAAGRASNQPTQEDLDALKTIQRAAKYFEGRMK